MISIPWTQGLSLDYLAGFQVERHLTHQVCYFDAGMGGFVSERPSAANAMAVSQTALSYFQSLSRTPISRNDELIFEVSIGQRRNLLHRPPFSSNLSLETGISKHGVGLSIRHLVNTSSETYLSSRFSLSFSEAAWERGLEDFLGISEHAKFDRILSRAFRHIGLPDDTAMDEYWTFERQEVTMEPQPLVPGGPGVAVRFDRLRPHDEATPTRLEFSVAPINPLGPYLPGGLLQLWRLGEKIIAG